MRSLSDIARIGLLASLALLSAVNANNKPGRRVKKGGKIQEAIDCAKPGETITVEPGLYQEQLTISKDGIHLVGQKGAVIQPPTGSSPTNGCAGLAGPNTVAGICIIGHDVKFADFVTEHRKVLSVGTYVKDVTVEGFEVRGFNGLNIAIVGGKHTEVRSNTVWDGTQYGILTVGSENTLITRNTATSSDVKFIAICMDDKSDVSVTQNVISNYFVGLCVQTNHADVGHNKVSNCCWGAYVDPGVDGARLTHNSIGNTNPLCGPYADGIVVDGAKNSDISHNDIFNINDGGNKTNIAAGILIFDDTPNQATGNQIVFNDIKDTDQDILNYAAGSNNIKHNHCKTPANICDHQ